MQYLEAGADVIISSSYQVSLLLFRRCKSSVASNIDGIHWKIRGFHKKSLNLSCSSRREMSSCPPFSAGNYPRFLGQRTAPRGGRRTTANQRPAGAGGPRRVLEVDAEEVEARLQPRPRRRIHRELRSLPCRWIRVQVNNTAAPLQEHCKLMNSETSWEAHAFFIHRVICIAVGRTETTSRRRSSRTSTGAGCRSWRALAPTWSRLRPFPTRWRLR